MKTPTSQNDPAAKSRAGDPPQEPLSTQVETVLKRKGCADAADLPLLRELIQSFEYNNNLILFKINWYKYGGLGLLIAIPVISTVIASIVNIQEFKDATTLTTWQGYVLPALSLCLALLTVLNSIFKPALRFSRVAHIGLDIFHWRCAFLKGLEELDRPDDKKLVEFLAKQLESFRQIQESQIGLALPDQDRIPSSTPKRHE